MDINTENTPLIDSSAIKIEPTSNTDDTTTPIEDSTTTTSPTDSVSLSQTAINVSRAETTTATETEDPQQNIDNITTDIQENPELALSAQSSQLTSSTVQSLIG
ncbi:MAG: hypothetical protein methR_P0974 [Methyloprofundus sp.]|nr:MAG: hypothetical protein methR_P0974 [Methyloprofundus sp.]